MIPTKTPMKAIRMHHYGDPHVLVYEQAPRPTLSENDVLIRIYAAGVNPADWKIRQGYLQDKFPFPMPLILGYDLAGIVEAVGDRVSTVNAGDAVFAMVPLHQLGAYAEYIQVPAHLVSAKPTTTDYATAASIPSIALTAWQALFDLGQLQTGQALLVHGASGGVGRFAVQFAKWKGATVYGTASAAHLDTIRQLGVDYAIDYTNQRFEDVAANLDLVLDTVGGETRQRSWSLLKPGGCLISTEGAADPMVSPSAAVRGVPIFVNPTDGTQLTAIARLIDRGIIQPPAVEVFPLDQAAQVHAAMQLERQRGKFVLQVDS